MADSNQGIATLRELGSCLSTSITCLKVLWAETINFSAKQDNSEIRQRHYTDHRFAVIRAKKLLNAELRRVIPEESVESVKSWCIRCEKTFDRVDEAVKALAGAHPRTWNPHPSTFTPDELEFGPEWEVVLGRTISRDTNSRHTDDLLWELKELANDVDNFRREILRVTPTEATIDKVSTPEADADVFRFLEKNAKQSSPLDPNAKAKTDETTEFSFEVHNEFVWIRGFSEGVMLEKTEGVERLIAVVTSPNRIVKVMTLAQIGEPPKTTKRDSIDPDGNGLTERESVNDERFGSALGDDALQAARDAVGDLMAERDAAADAGDDDKAERLTEQINASLDRLKPDLQKAAATVRRSLDRTYDRLRKDGEGKLLAAHFDKCVIRRRKSPDYVYETDESQRKIVWKVK